MKTRFIVLSSLALIVLLPLGLYGLLGSESGSRWLLHRILASLPAETSISEIEGTLLDRIQLKQLHIESPEQAIDIDRLSLAWQPGQLLTGTLKLVNVDIAGIAIVVKQSSAATESEPTDWQADLPLPLQVIIEKFSISDLHYEDGEAHYDLQKLNISALTEQKRLTVTRASLAAKPLNIDIVGQVTLGHGFPFAITVNWQIDSAEYGLWRAESRLHGNAEQLVIDSQQSSPFQLTLKGDVRDLQSEPLIDLRGDWQKLRWPLVGADKQLDSEQGFFEIKGMLRDYQLTLAGPLRQDYLPGAELLFTGNGNTDSLNIKALSIASEAGNFSLSGNLGWQSATVFDLNASGKRFNPAIFLPDLPGQLTFDTHVNGRIEGDEQTILLAINTLQGRLRDNPIKASGEVSLENDTVLIKQLVMDSGRNHIGANGTLAATKSNLTFEIDLPKLADLWPGLGGSLTGSGAILGNRMNPQLSLQAKGKDLRFAEHSIEHLLIDVDYHPEAGKSSEMNIETRKIKIAGNAITSLFLKGKGSPQQHNVNLDIKSPAINLLSSVSGSANDDAWQGTLQKFNLDGPDSGPWMLTSPVSLQAKLEDVGVAVNLAKTCLTQSKASFCVGINYQANSDFIGQFSADAIPTRLLKAYLPSDWQLNGQIDANAEFSQKKGVLSGRYRLTMPANSTVIVKQESGNQTIKLGGLDVNGDLNNKLLSGNAHLGLMASDSVNLAWQFNTHSNLLAKGDLTANIQQWNLIQSFLPGVSKLEGQLSANLQVTGKLDNPNIRGNLDLIQADIESAEKRFGIHDLEVHADAGDGNLRAITVNGAATPVFLSANDANEAMHFKGRMGFNAHLDKLQPLAGRFQIDLPADSRLSYKTAETNITIPFAASSLSGEFNDDKLLANLNLRLQNQDFVNSRLKVDTGAAGLIDGQIDASIRDLSVLDAAIPDLSKTQGQLKADLTLTGTLDNPKTRGSIELSQGATEIMSLGIAIHAINLNVTSLAGDSGQLQFQGSAQSGKGQIRIDGTTTLNGTGNITLQGQDFEVAKLPEAEVAVSPTLNLALSENSGKVTGTLAIPKALITLQEIPKNAITVSEDEIIVGRPEVEKKAGSNLAFEADVDVELGKQVHFSGLGLDTDLIGRLKIVHSNTTAMHGNIDMKKGRYKSYGQDLTIRKGRFVFNGPIDAPWLDVEATRLSKNQDVTAILNLSGPLKSPKTRILSEPALPEAEALAYLITGSPLNQVSKADGSMVASAALSYGAGKLSWLTEKLGIDEFEVKQGKTLQDTLVTVGQYFTPDFYVGTKVGIFNRQAMLVLKHKLTTHFNVETQTGTSQRVKLNYEIDTD